VTLQALFYLLSAHPEILGFFFLAIPLTAFLASIFGKGEGHLTPWKQLYCVLVYMAAIPGIFAITLNVYFFLFERRPIMESNIYTQIIPILIMVLTLWLIRRNVPFELIPGFDRLGGLAMIISAVLATMWLLDKTHIIAITVIPFYYVLIFMVFAFIGIRFGMKRLFKA
jgi:hypothetical protein